MSDMDLTTSELGREWQRDHPDGKDSSLSLCETESTESLEVVMEKHSLALADLKGTLATFRKRYGGDDVLACSALVLVARMNFEQGDYRLAQQQCEEVLFVQVRRTIRRDRRDDMQITETLQTLSRLYQAQGDHGEALKCNSELINLQTKLLGVYHPDVVQTLNRIGKLLHEQGKDALAIEVCSEALRISKRMLGGEHLDFAHALSNICAVQMDQGAYFEALEGYTEVLRIRRKVQGDEHVDVGVAYLNAGRAHAMHGELLAAHNKLSSARRVLSRALGEESALVVEVETFIDAVTDCLS